MQTLAKRRRLSAKAEHPHPLQNSGLTLRESQPLSLNPPPPRPAASTAADPEAPFIAQFQMPRRESLNGPAQPLVKRPPLSKQLWVHVGTRSYNTAQLGGEGTPEDVFT